MEQDAGRPARQPGKPGNPAWIRGLRVLEHVSFRFLSGKPFVQADVDSRLPVAVISESLARELFATTDATGKYLSVNAERIRVCGVVKDVSYATPTTVADLWMPMTRCPAFDDKDPDGRLNGAFWIYLTASTRAEKKQLRAEVQDCISGVIMRRIIPMSAI